MSDTTNLAMSGHDLVVAASRRCGFKYADGISRSSLASRYKPVRDAIAGLDEIKIRFDSLPPDDLGGSKPFKTAYRGWFNKHAPKLYPPLEHERGWLTIPSVNNWDGAYAKELVFAGGHEHQEELMRRLFEWVFAETVDHIKNRRRWTLDETQASYGPEQLNEDTSSDCIIVARAAARSNNYAKADSESDTVSNRWTDVLQVPPCPRSVYPDMSFQKTAAPSSAGEPTTMVDNTPQLRDSRPVSIEKEPEAQDGFGCGSLALVPLKNSSGILHAPLYTCSNDDCDPQKRKHARARSSDASIDELGQDHIVIKPSKKSRAEYVATNPNKKTARFVEQSATATLPTHVVPNEKVVVPLAHPSHSRQPATNAQPKQSGQTSTSKCDRCTRDKQRCGSTRPCLRCKRLKQECITAVPNDGEDSSLTSSTTSLNHGNGSEIATEPQLVAFSSTHAANIVGEPLMHELAKDVAGGSAEAVPEYTSPVNSSTDSVDFKSWLQSPLLQSTPKIKQKAKDHSLPSVQTGNVKDDPQVIDGRKTTTINLSKETGLAERKGKASADVPVAAPAAQRTSGGTPVPLLESLPEETAPWVPTVGDSEGHPLSFPPLIPSSAQGKILKILLHDESDRISFTRVPLSSSVEGLFDTVQARLNRRSTVQVVRSMLLKLMDSQRGQPMNDIKVELDREDIDAWETLVRLADATGYNEINADAVVNPEPWTGT